MATAKTKTDGLTCQCPISYHVETRYYGQNGQLPHKVAVLDEPLPDVMEMCFGRCQRCGLPYHTEFTSEETV
jgi:hypothetical protein